MSLISGGVSTPNSNTSYFVNSQTLSVTTTSQEFYRIAGAQEITLERAGFWCTFYLYSSEQSKNNNIITSGSNYIYDSIVSPSRNCTVTSVSSIAKSLRTNCFQIVETGVGAIYTYILRFSPVTNINPTIEITAGGPVNVNIRTAYPTLNGVRKCNVFTYTTAFNDYQYRTLIKIYGEFNIRIVNPDNTKCEFLSYGGSGNFPGIDNSNTFIHLNTINGGTISNVSFRQPFLYFTITSGTYIYDFILCSFDDAIKVKLNALSTVVGVGEVVAFDVASNFNKDY